MNTKEFLEMDYHIRAKKVNDMLQKYEGDSLKKVSEALCINYSTLCKEMAKGDYVYIKRDNKYYRFIRNSEEGSHTTTDYTIELNFIRNNLAKLETIITSTNTPFELDKRVYISDVLVNKNIKISEDIYNEFVVICQTCFPYLKIQDIISQCLLIFINNYK